MKLTRKERKKRPTYVSELKIRRVEVSEIIQCEKNFPSCYPAHTQTTPPPHTRTHTRIHLVNTNFRSEFYFVTFPNNSVKYRLMRSLFPLSCCRKEMHRVLSSSFL